MCMNVRLYIYICMFVLFSINLPLLIDSLQVSSHASFMTQIIAFPKLTKLWLNTRSIEHGPETD